MYVNARFISFFINILNLFLFITANVTISASKDRERRHLFPLLGYLHGYKIGQNFALQLPPFVLSPIIIIPSVNQQQSVNVQKSSSDDNYQEIGGTIQNISPARLVSTSIEINNEARQPIKSDKTEDSIHENNAPLNSEMDTLRQANIDESNTETDDLNEYSTTTPYAETTESELEKLQIKNVTKPSGLYPNAAYNNDKLSTLSITTAPLQYNLTVPNAEDKWPNFSQPLSESENNTYKYINRDNLNSTIENIIGYPTTELSLETKSYPYPNPWYNVKVDQFSITTNSYTNEESPLPPTYDDRWQRFSSLTKSNPSSGFRPLAGLYYDGFLHKPLTKEVEFMPHHINGYFYNG